jgi:hypothetical protein
MFDFMWDIVDKPSVVNVILGIVTTFLQRIVLQA